MLSSRLLGNTFPACSQCLSPFSHWDLNRRCSFVTYTVHVALPCSGLQRQGRLNGVMAILARFYEKRFPTLVEPPNLPTILPPAILNLNPIPPYPLPTPSCYPCYPFSLFPFIPLALYHVIILPSYPPILLPPYPLTSFILLSPYPPTLPPYPLTALPLPSYPLTLLPLMINIRPPTHLLPQERAPCRLYLPTLLPPCPSFRYTFTSLPLCPFSTLPSYHITTLPSLPSYPPTSLPLLPSYPLSSYPPGPPSHPPTATSLPPYRPCPLTYLPSYPSFLADSPLYLLALLVYYPSTAMVWGF